MFFRLINGLSWLIILLASTGTIVVLGLLVLSNGGIDLLGLRGRGNAIPTPISVGPTPVAPGGTPLPPGVVPPQRTIAPLNSVIPKRPLFKTLPLPQEVSRQPEVILSNLFLAILLALAFGATSTVLNDLIREQESRLQGWIRALHLGWLVRLISSGSHQAIRRGCLGLPIIMVIFAVYGIIFAFLESGTNVFSPAGVQLAMVMAMSVGLVSLGGDVAQRMVGRLWRSEGGYGLYPANLLLAIGTTLLSRSISLTPGIVFGVPGGADVKLKGAADQIRLREVTLTFTTLATTIFLAGLGWFGTGLLAVVGQTPMNPQSLEFLGPVAQLIQTIGLAIFAVAVQTVFFEMLPFSTTMGSRLFRWNGIVWGLTFIPIEFLFAHTMLNPTGNFLSAFQTANVRAVASLLIILIAITLIFWIYVRLIAPIFDRRRPQPGYAAAQPGFVSVGEELTQPINRQLSGKSQSEIPTQQPFQPPTRISPQPASPAARPTVVGKPRSPTPPPIEPVRPTLRPQPRPDAGIGVNLLSDTRPMKPVSPGNGEKALSDTRPMQAVKPDQPSSAEHPTVPYIPDAAALDPYAGLFPPAEPGEDEDIVALNETYILSSRKPSAEPPKDQKTILKAGPDSLPDEPPAEHAKDQKTILNTEPGSTPDDQPPADADQAQKTVLDSQPDAHPIKKEEADAKEKTDAEETLPPSSPPLDDLPT